MSTNTPTEQLHDLLARSLGRKIHDCLSAEGGTVMIVGGIIRDVLSGRTIPDYPDIDMAMTLPPDRAMSVLKKAGLRVIPTGLDHGTITVFEKHNDAEKIELTTLRVDLETDGRHADVAFTEDWYGDAERRDFTINAIYLGYDGTLYDPFNGQDDLQKGIVRFIGDADLRIQEDYLRMLRFFRFHAGFAKTPPDQDAITAIRQHAQGLHKISVERITNELDRLLMLPHHGLAAMVESGLDKILIPDGFDEAALKTLHQKMPLPPSLAARYAAIIPKGSDEAFTEHLKMSKVMRQAIHYISQPIEDAQDWTDQPRTDQYWPQKAWPHCSNRGSAWWQPRVLAEKFILSPDAAGLSQDTLTQMTAWDYPVFPLSGQDLIDQGFTPGEGLGIALQKLEDHWAESGFSASKSDLLSLATGLDLSSTSA